MARKYSLENPRCFPPGPGEISSVLGKLEALRRADSGSRVDIGTTVRVKDRISGEHGHFHLVWPREAAPKHGRISILSPLGAALLGARIGDEVSVVLFGCRCDFLVLTVWEAKPPEGSVVSL